MTDRERLMNELKKAKNRCLIKESGGCLACTHRNKADCTIENLADHLLANGVIVPQRETDEHKIQIGDVLYEYSYTYGKVHEWKVLDIWIENYISGKKTIVKCSNGTWTKGFFVADVLQFHKTKEEAEQALKERDGK